MFFEIRKTIWIFGKPLEIRKTFGNLENYLIFGKFFETIQKFGKILTFQKDLEMLKKIGNLEIGDLENWKLDIDIWISELLP